MITRATPIATALVLASCMNASKLDYPATRKDATTDDYHGTAVADPYRWLEDQNAPDVAAWVAAQNAVSFAYLSKLPGRAALEKRLTTIWNSPRVGLPEREGGRLFYARNSGLQQQAVHYVQASLASPPTEVLDPNKLSPDGTIAVAGIVPSPDGMFIAYPTAEGGADLQHWVVRDVARRAETGDTVRNVKFSGAAWTLDSKGFFYSRYPDPPKGEELTFKAQGHLLYYHRLGTPQADDALVFSFPDRPEWLLLAGVSENGRFLIVTAVRGTATENEIYVADLGDPMRPNVAAPLRPLITGSDAQYSPIDVVGTTLYARTDLDAPRRRIITVDIDRPARSGWRTVVEQSDNVLEAATLAGGQLVLQYLTDVKSSLRIVPLDGSGTTDIALPGIGTVAGLSGRNDTPEVWYRFDSFLAPSTVYRFDIATGLSEPFQSSPPAFDASAYETTQVFYPSMDGTRVSMFVTARKGMLRDGNAPVLMYAYGGFAIPVLPGYSPEWAAWLEMGGILAVPNLRGGSEYGDEWHKAGMLHNKQRVFDDFIAAAEFLVRERYTSPRKLAISGVSNGGLLVGAAMTQRPDLFAVALPAVGVMDMLRFDKFTAGVFWVTEYGSSTSKDDFPVLFAYSPLHNIDAGTCYPATMVTTADHDDRVVPGHSFKFAATLQAAQGCDRPAIIRIETQGSHGYRPTAKLIAEAADALSFTAANLQMSVKLPE